MGQVHLGRHHQLNRRLPYFQAGAVVVLSLILMLAARFGLRSAFFSIPRESDQPLRPGKSSSQNSVTPRGPGAASPP
jgi:hypothetical protein